MQSILIIEVNDCNLSLILFLGVRVRMRSVQWEKGDSYNNEENQTAFLMEHVTLNFSSLHSGNIHVDDALCVMKSEDSYNQLIADLSKRFEIADFGQSKEFFKIKLDFDYATNTIKLSQPYIIKQLLIETGMYDSKPVKSPMEPGKNFVKKELTEVEKKVMETIPFREVIGKLNYIATSTRPDICHCDYQIIAV